MTGLIPSKDDKEAGPLNAKHAERLYAFTLMWCVGAFLEWDDRVKMEEFLRNHEEFTIDLPVIPPDSDDTMFDYMVDVDGMYNFVHIFRCYQYSQILINLTVSII